MNDKTLETMARTIDALLDTIEGLRVEISHFERELTEKQDDNRRLAEYANKLKRRVDELEKEGSND